MAIKNQTSDVLAFALINYLLMDLNLFDAYKMKLVDKTGKVIREPKTDKEKSALNPYVVLIIRLKYLLGGKISNLNSFMGLKAMYGKNSTDSIINSLKSTSTNMNALKKLNNILETEK